MIATQKIEVHKTATSRLPQIDFKNLPFGKVYTDHMFVADFKNGAWSNLKIVPYGPITMSPAAPVLHYGQSIFEGMKGYRNASNEALVFRPNDNWERFNRSAERMCMPVLPQEIFTEGLQKLIDVDRNWIPTTEGSSLYIRPFMFSVDEFIGIRPFQEFTFMIILSPVGTYYSTPVKVKIETHYTRAIEGGTGFAKTGGNYSGSMYPAKLAQDKGYHQLLWTDGKAHEYIEESGTMNVMFVINDTLVTPALNDSILAGITRDSVLKLARHWGMNVEERKISVKELIEALKRGAVKEAFGAGTAATIAHIEVIGHEGVDYKLPDVASRVFSHKVYQELDRIKRGVAPDPFGWIVKM
jgi:branched-chain amino acid aminotransferase